MDIAGLMKLTLLDYPGKIACTVFFGGCNFRCPFCHNYEIACTEGEPYMSEEEFFKFLKGRKGILDGVCISGGEPTLKKELPEFIGKIKELGFKVKLDTNGYRPDVLKKILNDGLVDYVAMDIKNCPDAYEQTTGVSIDIKRIEQSIDLLVKSAVEFELRTTVIRGFHDTDRIEAMGKWLRSLSGSDDRFNFYIQPFTDRDTVPFKDLSAPDADELSKYKDILKKYFRCVSVRTIE